MGKDEKDVNTKLSLKDNDTARFMARSLSNLVNNLSEGIHKIKCKYGHEDKKCKTCGIKYKYWDCFLEYTNVKDDLIEYKFRAVTKIINTSLTKMKTKDFLIQTNFLTTTIRSLFYCCEKVFILMNIWMVVKNSMKHHYMKNKIFAVI